MRGQTLFVRLLRAGGVVLALELLWFAMGGRVDGVFPWLRRLGEGAFNLLLAPVAAVALAIAAPWIAARFRWPTSRTSPPEGARTLGSASIAIAVVALVAAWLHLLARATIPYTFSPDLADGAVICGASAATVVFAFRPPDLRRGLLREEVTLALARAGALLGGAAALVSVSGIIDTGRALGWRFRADDASWFVSACVALASCAALLAFVGRRWVVPPAMGARSAVEPADADEPARLRHVVSAAAIVLAFALVGEISQAAEAWRYRVRLYAEAGLRLRDLRSARSSADPRRAPESPEFDRILIMDGCPPPPAYADRAWTLAAGFAGFVLVAAVAGRRGRGDARPGRG
ncbi:MAG: hypothetical protein U1E39_11570 [Planctomycetota bacterium]